MATIVKTPTGKYRVRLYIGRDANGKQIFKSFTSDKKRELERMVKEFKIDQATEKEDPGVLFIDAVEQYIEAGRCTAKSPSSIRGYASVANVLRKSELCDIPLKDISFYDIQKFINDKSPNHAPNTIKNYMALISPVLKIYRPDIRLNMIQRPPLAEQDVVIPTDEQIHTMLDMALAMREEDLYKFLLLAAFCGLRRSEVCALQWDDIDRRNRILRVNKCRIRNELGTWVIKPVTKTKAGKRTVTLDPGVLAGVFKYRNASQRVIIDNPDAIYYLYKKITKQLGLPSRVHHLRHYHCSVLISLGYPEKYIIDRMGWHSADMIRRVYGHVIGQKQEALDLGLSEHTSTILEGKQYVYR